MPVTCAVATCRSTYKQNKVNGISFHLFPKDECLRQKWIQFCGCSRPFNERTWRICSLHFKENDFERNLQAELLNYIPNGRKLKVGVVPSHTLEENISTVQPEPMLIENSNLFSCKEEDNSIILKNTIEKLKRDLFVKDTQIRMLRKKIHTLKSLNRRKPTIVCKCSNILSKVFTPMQIRKVKVGKKVRWAAEDITRAFTLRYLSKRGYEYLRNSLNYPLPGISTLQKWAAKMDMQQGLLKTVLQFLKIAGTNMQETDRLVVLQYDEMKVAETYEYDAKHDCVIGPHSTTKKL